MSLFGTSNKENCLAIDIATDSIGVALIHNEKGKLPEIVYKTRLPYLKSSEGNNLSVEEQMIAGLKLVLKDASKDGIKALKDNGKPTHIDCALVGLSSLWFVSKLITRKIENPNGIKLDENTLKDLMNKEEIDFKKVLEDSYRDEGEVFEKTILNIAANGYKIENWHNKVAKEFEITFLISGSPKKLVYKIENEIIKTFGLKRGTSIQSINSVLARILLKNLPNIHSSLLIDISGETTSVLYTKNNIPEKTAQTSFGINSLSRNIADNLLLPMPIAESMLALFSKGDLDENTSKELDKVLLESEDEWNLNQNTMHSEVENSIQKIFLVTETKHAEVAKTMLQEVYKDKEINILDSKNGFIKGLISIRDKEALDGHLSVLSAFSHMLHW